MAPFNLPSGPHTPPRRETFHPATALLGNVLWDGKMRLLLSEIHSHTGTVVHYDFVRLVKRRSAAVRHTVQPRFAVPGTSKKTNFTSVSCRRTNNADAMASGFIRPYNARLAKPLAGFTLSRACCSCEDTRRSQRNCPHRSSRLLGSGFLASSATPNSSSVRQWRATAAMSHIGGARGSSKEVSSLCLPEMAR